MGKSISLRGPELCITTENIKGYILVVLQWRKGTVWMFFFPTAFARCHKSLIFLLKVCGIWPGSSFQTCVCFWTLCNSCWLLPICISWLKYVHRREKYKHVIHNSLLYFGNWGLETVVWKCSLEYHNNLLENISCLLTTFWHSQNSLEEKTWFFLQYVHLSFVWIVTSVS